MVSLHSASNLGLLAALSGTVYSCQPQGNAGLIIVEARTIEAVVALILYSCAFLRGRYSNCFFVVEKPGLDVADMGGANCEEDKVSQA